MLTGTTGEATHRLGREHCPGARGCDDVPIMDIRRDRILHLQPKLHPKTAPRRTSSPPSPHLGGKHLRRRGQEVAAAIHQVVERYLFNLEIWLLAPHLFRTLGRVTQMGPHPVAAWQLLLLP